MIDGGHALAPGISAGPDATGSALSAPMVTTTTDTGIITTAKRRTTTIMIPIAERRWLWAVTAVVGMLLLADVVLAVIGSPWQRPLGVPLALAAAVIGGGRVVYLALAALSRRVDRRRHRPGGRVHRGGLPG